jgi:hypothetical protein
MAVVPVATYQHTKHTAKYVDRKVKDRNENLEFSFYFILPLAGTVKATGFPSHIITVLLQNIIKYKH